MEFNTVGVPFVGTFAGALVASELLRYLHNGQLFDKVRYRMASPLELPTAQKGSIGDTDLGFFSYEEVGIMGVMFQAKDNTAA